VHHILIDKFNLDRAQLFKDRFPDRKLTVVLPPIQVPTTRSWPDNQSLQVISRHLPPIHTNNTE
jgi:hypothetical protein